MLDLSIIIPTFERAQLLERCLEHLARHVKSSFEVLVVDGASQDETVEVLHKAKRTLVDRMQVIHESKREGFVKAANKGFAAACGRNLMWLNDDTYPLPGSIDNAIRQIDAADDGVGLLAMFHRWNSTRNIAYETMHDSSAYRLCHVRGTLYANFAIGKHATFSRLGYFDERYFHLGADPDFSLKSWNAGLRVEPAYSAIIEHDQTNDRRREQEASAGHADNAKLFTKWDLPAKKMEGYEFDPQSPCTLRGERESQRAIAA